MNKQELIEILKEDLTVDVEVEDSYNNGFLLTVKLRLGEDVISENGKWVNIDK